MNLEDDELDAPQNVKSIYVDIIWSLLMKMNVSTEDAEQMIEVLERDGMGYLFENMEKMDIQAERENTRIQRERADKAEKQVEQEKIRAEQAEEQNLFFKKRLIMQLRSKGYTKEQIITEVQDILMLDRAEAQQLVQKYTEED